MKISSLLYGMVFAVVVVAVLLLIMGVSFHRPVSAQGAALYNATDEVVVGGRVQEVQEFDCPVSEGELASHLMLRTADGLVQVHLAPASRRLTTEMQILHPVPRLCCIRSCREPLFPFLHPA